MSDTPDDEERLPEGFFGRLGAGIRDAFAKLRPQNRRVTVPYVAQLTPTDCGVACLTAVLRLHRRHLPVHKVRAALAGGRNGVNAKAILVAARTMGLRARGVAITPDKLAFLPPGSILHWELNHFIVFEGVTSRGMAVMDPARGRREIEHADIEAGLSGVALVLEPGEGFIRVKRNSKLRWARYRAWLFSTRDTWGRLVLTSLVLQILAMSMPGMMGAVVDKVVPRADNDLLVLIACAFLSVAAFHFLTTFLRSRLLLQLRTEVETRMSFDFVHHLFGLPFRFFQERSAGDLAMRMSSQSAIREILTTGSLSAMLDGVLVIGYFAVLVSAAPKIALIAIVLAILQGGLCILYARQSRSLAMEGLSAQARLEGYQVELLHGIEPLKAMAGGERAIGRWEDLYVESLNRTLARGALEGTFSSLLGAVRFAGPVVILLQGAALVLDGSLPLGTMLGLSALASGFLEPVSNLVSTGLKLTQLEGFIGRIEDVLDTPMESSQPARGTRITGNIRVQDVGFHYASEPKPALEDVSLSVDAGECIAIVGSSGSGKSTLARIIAGLYEPDRGSVFIDDIDTRGLPRDDLRAALGVVTQDTRLFAGSLRDNVTMFDETIPLEVVAEACAAAALDVDIAAMPMGYDTVLADGGSSISGGQRQRLALARALVRKPKILVLDEATSALDTVTEQRVQACLHALGCTRIVVAHRLSTVVSADKIVVMVQGKVLATGTHDELLRTCPTYAAFVQHQDGHGGQRAANAPALAAPPKPRRSPTTHPA
jgi:ATP-binding cassette subfamily B protein